MLHSRLGKLGRGGRRELQVKGLGAEEVLHPSIDIGAVRLLEAVQLIVVGVLGVAELGVDIVPFLRRRVGLGQLQELFLGHADIGLRLAVGLGSVKKSILRVLIDQAAGGDVGLGLGIEARKPLIRRGCWRRRRRRGGESGGHIRHCPDPLGLS